MASIQQICQNSTDTKKERLFTKESENHEARNASGSRNNPSIQSYLYDGLDEDLFQECSIAFLHCIEVFELSMDE